MPQSNTPLFVNEPNFLVPDSMTKNRWYYTSQTLGRFNSVDPDGKKVNPTKWIVRSELVIRNFHLTVDVNKDMTGGISASAKIHAKIPTQDVDSGIMSFHVGGSKGAKGLFEISCDGDAIVAREVVTAKSLNLPKLAHEHDTNEFKPRLSAIPSLPRVGDKDAPTPIHWFQCDNDYQDTIANVFVHPLKSVEYAQGVHGTAFNQPRLVLWPIPPKTWTSWDLNIPVAVTLSAWVKASGDGMILSKGYGNSINYSLSLNGGKVLLTYLSSVEPALGGRIYNLRTDKSFPVDGEWHQVIGVIDTNAKVMDIYIDGEHADSSIEVPNDRPGLTRDEELKMMRPMVLNPDPLTIGFAYLDPGIVPRDHNSAPVGNEWGGLLDEIMIYNQALTKSQVQNLYDATKK
jgi:hypothetical protein